jgi:hypothetical protein
MNIIKGVRLMPHEDFPDQIPYNELKSRLKKYCIEFEDDGPTEHWSRQVELTPAGHEALASADIGG